MKLLVQIFLALAVSSASGKMVYIGSTPAGAIVRNFLGIPLNDSVDFIRWKLVKGDNVYAIDCDYGIGKPNTNGFIDKKQVHITGTAINENNFFTLYNGNRTLVFAALNQNVLHVAGRDKRLLAGTGGWSYTLSHPDQSKLPLTFPVSSLNMKDSMTFIGRSPCMELTKMGLTVSENCYKLKWSIVLYSSHGKPTTYKTRGTAFRNAEPKYGPWHYKNGMITLEGLGQRIYFLVPDENIIVFTDSSGNLLQGDEDFAYTLSRK